MLYFAWNLKVTFCITNESIGNSFIIVNSCNATILFAYALVIIMHINIYSFNAFSVHMLCRQLRMSKRSQYARCVFIKLIRWLNTSLHIYIGLHTHTFTVSKTVQRRAVSSGVLRLQTKAWILIFWLYFYCTSDPIRRHLTLKQEYIVYI